MEIVKTDEGSKLTFAVKGRLDTVTSPELQAELDKVVDAVNDFVFDFSALDYISSAGLRVLLSMNKKMAARGGSLLITGANAVVKDVFDMTGFSDILKLA